MTVLVTGGAGYIGSHTVHALADAGERVVVLDNLSTGFVTTLPAGMLPIVGCVSDQTLVAELIEDHGVESIIHFAGSTIVPDSIKDPLGYYGNNTANSRALIEAAIRGGVRHFIFSSTAAVYGNPARVPVGEDDPTVPLSPYGWSKLMTEVMLHDASAAHALSHVALRYFNVAGADPQMRTGLSTPGATHLIKVAVEAALGRRARIDVYGTDYPTPDGTCIRDFIHVSDLARAHLAALNYLRGGDVSATLNAATAAAIRSAKCWTRFAMPSAAISRCTLPTAAPATSWCRSPPQTASVRCWTGLLSLTTSTRSSATRSPGNAI